LAFICKSLFIKGYYRSAFIHKKSLFTIRLLPVVPGELYVNHFKVNLRFPLFTKAGYIGAL